MSLAACVLVLVAAGALASVSIYLYFLIKRAHR